MSSQNSGPHLNRDVGNTTRKWFNDMPMAEDPDYIVVYDDFLENVFNTTDGYWDDAVKDSGASVAITADELHGAVGLISTTTTDNDGASLQTQEIFAAVAAKTLWYECRVKNSVMSQSDLFFGLSENFVTHPENCLTASNRIGFQVDDGNASILCVTESGDTETSTDSAQDGVDDTYVQLGFKVIGTGTVEFYVDRALVATHTANIPTANLAASLMSVSGNTTGTRRTDVDYVRVVALR